MSYLGQSRPRLLLKGCHSRQFHVLYIKKFVNGEDFMKEEQSGSSG